MGDAGRQRTRLGCAGTLATVNTTLIGLVAAAFAPGPFSGADQMLWYRGVSLALLVIGALGPAMALATVARRSPVLTIGLTLWMLVALVVTAGYAIRSGGGI